MRIGVPPRRLILSGGGIRVISYIGVLQVLEENKLLEGIREFCGVSAGALIATMMALGYSLQKLERFFLEYDFSNIRTLEPESFVLLFENFGIDSGKRFEELIHKFLYHKGFGPKTTFKELEESGRCKGIRMWAADLQNVRPIEFSAKTTPNIEIAFALRATTSIPGYFIPLKHPDDGRLLTDGGIYDNYPINLLTKDEIQLSLGVAFKYKEIPRPCNEFGDFLGLVISGYYMPSYQSLIKKYKNRTIEVPCYEFSCLNFEAEIEEKKELIQIGRNATLSFLEMCFYKGRRHSIS